MHTVDFDEIRNELSFWLYFLSTAFPLAYDEDEDIALADFLAEKYDLDKAIEWAGSFIGYSGSITEENDGYSEDPTSVVIDPAAGRYRVEFHPGDILYFKDGKKIGSTGPHYEVYQISLDEFKEIYRETGLAAVLLLPMVYHYSGEEDFIEAAELIQSVIEKLPVREEYIPMITFLLVEGLELIIEL